MTLEQKSVTVASLPSLRPCLRLRLLLLLLLRLRLPLPLQPPLQLSL
jgi:hypothetical protein